MYLVAGLMRLYSPLLSKNNDNAESVDDELTLLNLIILALTIIGSAIMQGISVANLFPSHLVSNPLQSVCNSSSNGKEGVMNAAIVDETVNANAPNRHRRCEEGTTEHSMKSVGRFNSADEELEGGDDTGNEEASTFLSTQCRPLSSVCQPGLLGFLYARGKSSERNAKITYTRTLSRHPCRGIQLCCPAQQKVII